MTFCPKCSADIIPGSKYCHRCGDHLAARKQTCPSCNKSNGFNAVYCQHCGYHLKPPAEAKPNVYQAAYPLSFSKGNLIDQVDALFFKSLRERVREEGDERRYNEFVARFYDSRFRTVYSVRCKQIAEESASRWERFGMDALPDIDRLIGRAFDGLLDYFIIQHCADLCPVILPSEILRYEQVRPTPETLPRMVFDYLDLKREKERIYTDFINIQREVLLTACLKFLKAGSDERVLFLCDTSLKGVGAEGFAMSNKAIYWKSPMQKSAAVYYEELENLEKRRDWLLINGRYFHINPSLDLKVYKLLKKLSGAWA
ncbi:MAG: zinc ribbon domain-containing protein [Saprospiraceae bacterium]